MKCLISFFFFIGQSEAAFACDEKPSTTSAVYLCLLEKHPSLKALNYRSAEAEARLKAADQFPNPEIEVKSLVSGEKETEIELLQPIEIGGRRSARKERANAEGNLASVQDISKIGEIAFQAAESLTRLRQLEQGLVLMGDARVALTSIVKRLQAKRSLTPEDRTVLSLFRLYESTLLQKIKLQESERDSLNRMIESVSGVSLSGINWQKEPRRIKWPSLSRATESGLLEERAAQAELAVATAEAGQASGEAWPELSIGPTFKRFDETRQDNWGLKLNFTLPIWNLNGGARAFSRSKIQQAEANLQAVKVVGKSSLASLQSTFEKAIVALESAPRPGSLNKLVSESERQFARGLIQPNALVEIYRSSLESLEVTNETELRALRAYFQHETTLGLVPKELL
ncbi:MAG: TolC family protein [Bdellovibrionales bacterium]|jgi:cobalt-zinc-cadmium efflux system outer membrane protein|nr:TolC family protein [Bdellovibrionales bacterium]